MRDKKNTAGTENSPAKKELWPECLTTVLDCLVEAVVICDLKGSLLLGNQAFLCMFGISHADRELFFQKATIESLLLGKGGISRDEVWWDRLDKEGVTTFECQLSSVNEKLQCFASITIRPVVVEGDTLMLVSLRDVTARRFLAVELAAAKKNIEDLASGVHSEFLANMSHELRTPMHSILSCARLGARKVDSVPRKKLKSYLEMIVTSGDQLLLLLNDLLALSAPESCHAAYTLEERNLVKDIGKVIVEFRGLMEESEISLIYELPKCAALARYDATKIYQVLRNLLSNALKFSASNKTIRVTLKQGSIGQGKLCRVAYKVSVIDQGMGLDTEELQSVFEKFTQGRRVKTGIGGVGLGLSICKRIIEDHEGVIWAEQNEDKGTTFSFLLPALQ